MSNFTLNLRSFSLTDEQFGQICRNNRDFRFERSGNGDLTIMSPTGGETSNCNAGLIAQLWIWNEQTKLGKVFDSSGGFRLPNGADRSPDAAWIPLSRWNSLTPEQQRTFLPLCPNFVIELRSPSDSLKGLQQKMKEYQENGTQLGWLINRPSQRIEIYRLGQTVEILQNPVAISGEEVLPGFELRLEGIW